MGRLGLSALWTVVLSVAAFAPASAQHPDMIGAVNSTGGPPPVCEGPYCAPQ